MPVGGRMVVLSASNIFAPYIKSHCFGHKSERTFYAAKNCFLNPGISTNFDDHEFSPWGRLGASRRRPGHGVAWMQKRLQKTNLLNSSLRLSRDESDSAHGGAQLPGTLTGGAWAEILRMRFEMRTSASARIKPPSTVTAPSGTTERATDPGLFATKTPLVIGRVSCKLNSPLLGTSNTSLPTAGRSRGLRWSALGSGLVSMIAPSKVAVIMTSRGTRAGQSYFGSIPTLSHQTNMTWGPEASVSVVWAILTSWILPKYESTCVTIPQTPIETTTRPRRVAIMAGHVRLMNHGAESFVAGTCARRTFRRNRRSPSITTTVRTVTNNEMLMNPRV